MLGSEAWATAGYIRRVRDAFLEGFDCPVRVPNCSIQAVLRIGEGGTIRSIHP